MPIFYRPPPPTKPKPVPGVMTIRQHRPWCPFLAILTIVIIGAGGWFYMQTSLPALGQSQTFTEPVQPGDSHQQLKKTLQKNRSLMAQNKELRTKMVMVVRAMQESQDTYANVLLSLEQLQEENLNLIEELTFYKRLLISPKNPSTEKVVVTNLTLNYDRESGNYLYQLVLTQWTKDAKVAQGVIQIYLQGQINGNTKRLGLKSVTENSTHALEYKFNFFQRLEGELKLPAGFIPDIIIVNLLPKGEQKFYENRFEWKELQQNKL